MILSFRYYNPQEPQLLCDFPKYVLTVSPKAIYLYNCTKNAEK